MFSESGCWIVLSSAAEAMGRESLPRSHVPAHTCVGLQSDNHAAIWASNHFCIAGAIYDTKAYSQGTYMAFIACLGESRPEQSVARPEQSGAHPRQQMPVFLCDVCLPIGPLHPAQLLELGTARSEKYNVQAEA